jgi:hypothetical protein
MHQVLFPRATPAFQDAQDRTPTDHAVLGLDLSLTGSAAVVLPKGWNPSAPWTAISFQRFGEQGALRGQERTSAIVHAVWKLAVREGVTKAFVEQYAFSFAPNAITHVAELVGAIKETLHTSLKIETVPIVASSARKLLFGKLPRMSRKETKALIKSEFEKLGAPFPDEDTRDAFIVCNAARHTLGLPCLASG